MAVACAGAMDAGAAGIWRWVAADGVVTYGERPPAGVDATPVTTHGAPPSARAAAVPAAEDAAVPAAGDPAAAGTGTPAPGTPARLSDAQRQLDAELSGTSAQRLANVERVRAENCAKARELFEQLTQFARLRVTDASGASRALTEEERRARLDEVRADIVEYCTP
jgi:hypothetical protein